MTKILNSLIDIFIIIGLIFIIGCIGSEIYKNIKVTNNIEVPDICIKINDEYYCKKIEKDKIKEKISNV